MNDRVAIIDPVPGTSNFFPAGYTVRAYGDGELIDRWFIADFGIDDVGRGLVDTLPWPVRREDGVLDNFKTWMKIHQHEGVNAAGVWPRHLAVTWQGVELWVDAYSTVGTISPGVGRHSLSGPFGYVMRHPAGARTNFWLMFSRIMPHTPEAPVYIGHGRRDLPPPLS